MKSHTPENTVHVKHADMFFLLLKSTHGGGHYFIGHLQERENGLCITGDIVHNPDENGNPKISHYTTKEKIKDFFQITIGFFLFWWFLIVLGIIDLLSKIFAKGKNMTLEEMLDAFMIHNMGCEKADKFPE